MKTLRIILLISLLFAISGCASYDYLLCGDSGVYEYTGFPWLRFSAICNKDKEYDKSKLRLKEMEIEMQRLENMRMKN